MLLEWISCYNLFTFPYHFYYLRLYRIIYTKSNSYFSTSFFVYKILYPSSISFALSASHLSPCTQTIFTFLFQSVFTYYILLHFINPTFHAETPYFFKCHHISLEFWTNRGLGTSVLIPLAKQFLDGSVHINRDMIMPAA